MPCSWQSKSIASAAAISFRNCRADTASRAVAIVFSSYFEMAARNSAIHDILCQDGAGPIRRGAPGVSIHFRPLATFAQLFHTSAFDADNWPPLANEVSIAA